MPPIRNRFRVRVKGRDVTEAPVDASEDTVTEIYEREAVIVAA